MVNLFESVEDRIKALSLKYSTIKKDDFLAIVDVDPTRNKIYLQWLLNLRVKNKLPDEDFEGTFLILETFEMPKVRQLIRDKDINSYKSVGELYEVIYEATHTGEIDVRNKNTVKEQTLVAENSNWTVHIPKTHEESKVLGTATNWCTAADSADGRLHFDTYNERNPLIIFINKHNPREKYQLHNGDEQSFLNKNDDKFDIFKIFGNDKNLFKNTPIIFENLGIVVKMILSLFDSKDLTIETNLKLNMGEYNSDFQIPDNLTVKGSLRIENYRHKKLPENLTVFGTLSIFHSDIDEIPKSLKLIQNNSKYENNFNLKPSKKVKKFTFPDNYTIGKNVSFSLIGIRDWIEFYGDNLTINGNLLIPAELTENVNIDNLTNLKVNGNIYRTPILSQK